MAAALFLPVMPISNATERLISRFEASFVSAASSFLLSDTDEDDHRQICDRACRQMRFVYSYIEDPVYITANIH